MHEQLKDVAEARVLNTQLVALATALLDAALWKSYRSYPYVGDSGDAKGIGKRRDAQARASSPDVPSPPGLPIFPAPRVASSTGVRQPQLAPSTDSRLAADVGRQEGYALSLVLDYVKVQLET